MSYPIVLVSNKNDSSIFCDEPMMLPRTAIDLSKSMIRWYPAHIVGIYGKRLNLWDYKIQLVHELKWFNNPQLIWFLVKWICKKKRNCRIWSAGQPGDTGYIIASKETDCLMRIIKRRHPWLIFFNTIEANVMVNNFFLYWIILLHRTIW